MHDDSIPKLSIGLPVYNGADYLEDSLDSILAQTFQHFELLISDNASTDRTEEICMAYAGRDSRIRYCRRKENLGASTNFNYVFALSSGKYFKWIAHDDLHEEDFLSRCVQILDQDPSIILAYSRAITVDAQKRLVTREWGAGEELGSVKPHIRFRKGLEPPHDPIPLPIFGVVRADILRKTHLMAGYPDSDRALVAELTLHGRFYEIPDPLFLQREHKDRAGPRLSRDPYWAVTFWDVRKQGKINFPHWALFSRHLSAVNNAPLSSHERFSCYKELLCWFKRNWELLILDLIIVAESIPVCGRTFAQAYKKFWEINWAKQLQRSEKEIASLVPAKAKIILVDGDSFGIKFFAGRDTLPFLERDGQYYGPPPDDGTAICELERLREAGARFMIFGWPAFWWLDFYKGLHDYLNLKFKCILKNSRLITFDLNE